MILLICSVAVNELGYKYRKPKDFDLIVNGTGLANAIMHYTGMDFKETSTPGYWKVSGRGFTGEVDCMDTESNRLLMKMTPHDVRFISGLEYHIPRISTLAAIKESHLRSDVNCFKTFHDWKFFRDKLKDHPYTPEDKEFLEARRHETMERLALKQKRINLNVKNDKFFKNSQSMRKLDHDDVHRIVAFNDIPVFEMVKRDISKAKVDKELFDTLPKITKQQMVLEESFVIGYERFSEKNKNAKKVYDRGLAYFATTLCKGWFQDYIFENIDFFIDYEPEFNFINKIDEHIERLQQGK